MRSIKPARECLFLILVFPIILCSCAATGVSESPFRAGIGAYTMPGIALSSKTELHATLGYSRVNFQGGGGHNNFFQIGPHFRWPLGTNNQKGFWVGAEATYVNVSAIYDNSDMKSTGSGYTIGPAGGYRFRLGKVPFSAYIAPAYLHRGDLKSDGQVWVPASNGFLGRIGIDLEFMSLLSDKGR
jgi:hypothetical protein